MAIAPDDAAVEKSAMRKIYLRLLPFAILCYILAYIDRINSSFAALTMRADLNMSAADFGFAVGTFYWAYFLFEVPSNVIMEKVGARIWIARIMVTWGIFATATAFVTGTTSFAIMRFLLGIAEAGFFPGVAKAYQERLSKLGTIRKVSLLERKVLGDDRVYTYELESAAESLIVTLGLAPDAKVSLFSIRPKEPPL